jgi:hypothetical protein
MRTGTLIEYDGLSLSSIEWSAVFAGTFLALGVGLIVGLIGLLIGAGGPNTESAVGFKGISTLTGAWSLITAFIAFYSGGWFAARLCGSPIAGDGRVHGIVTWAFATVATIVVLGLESHVLARLLSALLLQPTLTGNMVTGILGSGTVWVLLATICGLIGGAIGGHVGGPRITEVAETGEDNRRQAA